MREWLWWANALLALCAAVLLFAGLGQPGAVAFAASVLCGMAMARWTQRPADTFAVEVERKLAQWRRDFPNAAPHDAFAVIARKMKSYPWDDTSVPYEAVSIAALARLAWEAGRGAARCP